ncbi:hypothetical protein U9M48_011756 [Paspalum notatum var. saurae]|uniref:Uncharacterized protein n=1 Tax=Paspalum notatum var. saurae TaxID=547442 RepID=A0AAQ3SWI0_PASNO
MATHITCIGECAPRGRGRRRRSVRTRGRRGTRSKPQVPPLVVLAAAAPASPLSRSSPRCSARLVDQSLNGALSSSPQPQGHPLAIYCYCAAHIAQADKEERWEGAASFTLHEREDGNADGVGSLGNR